MLDEKDQNNSQNEIDNADGFENETFVGNAPENAGPSESVVQEENTDAEQSKDVSVEDDGAAKIENAAQEQEADAQTQASKNTANEAQSAALDL